jgi:cleavage and polyadenylation specificity factor subunit 2
MGRVVCLAEVDSWRGELPADMPNQIKAEMDAVEEKLRGPFVATVEEVHEAFDWVKAIRYNQPLHLGGGSPTLHR